MFDYNGNDLLKVFSELNIKANPNFVQGLFDTDDNDLKSLLNWLCSSISSDNYLPPLEEKEFETIEATLTGQKYNDEVRRVEAQYPEIFDLEMNTLDVDLLGDEIEVLLEEEQKLNNLLKIENDLDVNLTKELNEHKALEIKTAAILNSTQDHCSKLAHELDSLNEKIDSKSVSYAGRANDFGFSSELYFINNIDINLFEEKFNAVAQSLGPFLDVPTLATTNLSNATSNASSFNMSRQLNESMNNELILLRERILSSLKTNMISRMEIERYTRIINYLNKLKPQDILFLRESDDIESRISDKENKCKWISMKLNNTAMQFADEKIAAIKLKYLYRELGLYQSKLDTLNGISDDILELLTIYLSISIMTRQEKKYIGKFDQFFQKNFKESLSAMMRTDKMEKIIENYTKNKKEDHHILVKTISKIVTGKDLELDKAFTEIIQFKSEYKTMEEKLFNINFKQHRSKLDDMQRNINVLRQFLKCSPTSRIVLVPFDLQLIVLNVEEMLKKQKEGIKSGSDKYALAIKKRSEWENYRRQLWMYFYADPQKLDFILQKIEDEYTKNGLRKGLL